MLIPLKVHHEIRDLSPSLIKYQHFSQWKFLGGRSGGRSSISGLSEFVDKESDRIDRLADVAVAGEVIVTKGRS